MSEVRIPRWFSNKPCSTWTLHLFCDASKQAYAAAIFLRSEGGDVQLLQAKSRVSPIKRITIPRLELMACLIGSRLVEAVRKALDMKKLKCYYWTDSTTALAWIKRNDIWGTLVGNRVKEICRNSSSEDWRYVPGIINPADLPSRGCVPVVLMRSKWWEGPSWLRDKPENWPSNVNALTDEEIVSLERRKLIHGNVNSTIGSCLWDRISSYSRLIRVASYVWRFYQKLKKTNEFSGNLTVREIQMVEKVVLRQVQSESFDMNTSEVKGLRVMRDCDGQLRVLTKLLYLEDTTGFKTPILLPSKHRVVEMIIREAHLMNCHAGTKILMGNLRENFWILQSRRSIRSVLAKCIRCKRYSGKSFDAVPTALPKDRVSVVEAFQVIGVDLAGPLFLKDGTKVWIVLYTCAVYRAVHLELVVSLSTEAFLQYFRRFVARRGRPSIVYSDNGTNFVGAVNLLRELDWKKIAEDWIPCRIEWRFNPPTAAWWGGWWERLVRCIKELWRRVLENAKLNYEGLITALCDVEAVINGRPLTYISEGSDLQPLTPSMFIQDMVQVAAPDLDYLDCLGFQKRLRHCRSVRDQLAGRFRREYLSQLVQKGKDDRRFKNITVGDVVMTGSDNVNRFEWPMAKVSQSVSWEGRDSASG